MNFFASILGDTPAAYVLTACALLAAGFLAGKALRFILGWLRERVAARTKSVLDELIIDVLRSHVTTLLVLIAAFIGARGIRDGLARGGIDLTWITVSEQALYVLVVLTVAYILSRFIDAVVVWYLHDVAAKTETRLDDELAPFINRILNILVFLTAVIIVLDHFGQNISSLVVSLGVGSLAIALAAQDTLSNMIAGFVLMVDRPFRVGDRIKLPSGAVGNVTHIGIRSTKVINDNNIMIITPNSEIVKSQISNMSYPNDVVRFDVDFSVAYGTDLEGMSRLLVARVNGEADVVDHGKTEVRIIRFGESGVDCQLFVRIKDPRRIPLRYSDMLRLIYRTLGEARIAIPYPQRVMHLSAMDAEQLRRFSQYPGGDGPDASGGQGGSSLNR